MAILTAQVANLRFTLNPETGSFTVTGPDKMPIELTSENLPQYFDIPSFIDATEKPREFSTILHRLLDKYKFAVPLSDIPEGTTTQDKDRAKAKAKEDLQKEKEELIKITTAIIERIDDIKLLLHMDSNNRTIMQAAISAGALTVQLNLLDKFELKSPGNKKDIFTNQENFDGILQIIKDKLKTVTTHINNTNTQINTNKMLMSKPGIPKKEKEEYEAQLRNLEETLQKLENKKKKLEAYKTTVSTKLIDTKTNQTSNTISTIREINELVEKLQKRIAKLPPTDPLANSVKEFTQTLKAIEYLYNAKCSYVDEKLDDAAYSKDCYVALANLHEQLASTQKTTTGLFGSRSSHDKELALIKPVLQSVYAKLPKLPTEEPPTHAPRGPGGSEASGNS